MIPAAVALSFLLGLGLGLIFRARANRAGEPPASDSLLDRIHDGVVVLDQNGAVLSANRKAFEMLGLDQSQARDRIRLALRRNPDLARFLDEASGDPPPEAATVEVGFPNVRHLRVQASTLHTPGGGGSGLLLLSLTDVTRVEELERVRRRFTADLSHEIRTPVTSIRLLAESLDDSGGAPDHAGRILREAGRLERLVDQILTLSRLESGEVGFDPGAFRLGDLVDEALDRVRSQVSSRGVSVSCDLDEHASWWGDFEKLLRLLEIYLDNALKYSPEGGTITIHARRERGQHWLTVTDQGPGIPVEEQPHVFRRFYKGHRQPGTVGFGLGLAIAKHSALTHGGDVFVTSRVGEGSTFGVRLPASGLGGRGPRYPACL